MMCFVSQFMQLYHFIYKKKSGKLSFSIRFALNLINHPSKRWALIRVEGAN